MTLPSREGNKEESLTEAFMSSTGIHFCEAIALRDWSKPTSNSKFHFLAQRVTALTILTQNNKLCEDVIEIKERKVCLINQGQGDIDTVSYKSSDNKEDENIINEDIEPTASTTLPQSPTITSKILEKIKKSEGIRDPSKMSRADSQGNPTWIEPPEKEKPQTPDSNPPKKTPEHK